MVKKKIQLAADQRPFIMVYKDFLESNVLDNYYQKLIYIYLKKFADSKNQCYPSLKTISKQSGISLGKVKITLKELEEKGIISKTNRNRPDGGKSSNFYILNDYKELWNAGSGEKVGEVIDEIEEKRMIAALTAKGYHVTKEEEPESATNQSNDSDPTSNKLINQQPHDNIEKPECQEQYSLEEVRQLYDYDILLQDNPSGQETIDAAMDVLHTALNVGKPTIRIGGEDKPTEVVKGRLVKLTHLEVGWALEKFMGKAEEVKNPSAYLLTILYSAKEQSQLEAVNRVSVGMAKGKVQLPD